MERCKICGYYAENLRNGICYDCLRRISMNEPNIVNSDLYDSSLEEYERDFTIDDIYAGDAIGDTLVVTDTIQDIVDSLDMDIDEEDSDDYNDFVDNAILYDMVRADIANNPIHKDDYKKLFSVHKKEIESCIYKIGLASELRDTDKLVDSSRGVVVFERK